MVGKIFILAFFCCLLQGCWGDNYFPEKEIQYKNARVTWYYRFLGDNRRDFVEVSKGFRQKIVMNCIGLFITDINIVNDSLVIKTHGETLNGIYEFKDNGLGIPIRIDPSATQNEFNKIYNPKFYKPGEK